MNSLILGRTISKPAFDGAAVFHEMTIAMEKAVASNTVQTWESDCTFAGKHVRIRIMGNALVKRMMRPFKHLLSQNGDRSSVRLRIDLWHEAETSVGCPVSLVNLQSKYFWTNWEGEYGLTLGSPSDRYIACQRPSILTCLDRQTEHLVGWIGDHKKLSLYEGGKPLHLPLLLWHHDQDVPVIHAGLVAKNGRGVLLVGKGDTGKSTCALACLLSGFDYIGDDYIGLSRFHDGTYTGYGLYNSTWLSSDNLPRFPAFAPHAISPASPAEGKHLVPLVDILPEHLAASAPIQLIVLPRIVTGPTRYIPASKGKALFAVAPSSIILLPSSGAQSLNRLEDLLKRVPCYWLEVDSNVQSIPEEIEKLLRCIG
jgi:hypothetical protein